MPQQHSARRIECTCERCGAPFPILASRLRHQRGRFCSRSCRANAYVERRWGALSERFWTNVDRSSGADACWPWIGATDGHGYGQISLDSHPIKASRLAYLLAKGAIPDGALIRHTCDNPPCCNPSHLIPGTHADNSRDMRERGRQNLGVRNPRSLLTEDAVRAIRAAVRDQTATQRELATRYGVSIQCVNAVVRGRAWQHVS